MKGNIFRAAVMGALLGFGQPYQLSLRSAMPIAKITERNLGYDQVSGRPVAVRSSPNRLSQKARRKRARWSS